MKTKKVTLEYFMVSSKTAHFIAALGASSICQCVFGHRGGDKRTVCDCIFGSWFSGCGGVYMFCIHL